MKRNPIKANKRNKQKTIKGRRENLRKRKNKRKK